MESLVPTIETLVLELTNQTDINSVYYIQTDKISSLKVPFIRKILKQNRKLKFPIKYFELGGHGNPLLHKKIGKILRLIKNFNINFSILTNGLNLREITSFLEDELIEGIDFGVYLSSVDEVKNDYLMGVKGVFKKTLESLEYLSSRDLVYDIVSEINSFNYKEITDLIFLTKFYRCRMLIPVELFPQQKVNSKFLLNDRMKLHVLKTINKLEKSGEPIKRTIQFLTPTNNCTYLRLKRIFVDSRGKLSFCHFLSRVFDTTMINLKDINLEKAIEINNKTIKRFVNIKGKKLVKWKLPRKTSSPCSYCVYTKGSRLKW